MRTLFLKEKSREIILSFRLRLKFYIDSRINQSFGLRNVQNETKRIDIVKSIEIY